MNDEYLEKFTCEICGAPSDRIDWIKLSPIVGLRISAYDYVKNDIYYMCSAPKKLPD